MGIEAEGERAAVSEEQPATQSAGADNEARLEPRGTFHALVCSPSTDCTGARVRGPSPAYSAEWDGPELHLWTENLLRSLPEMDQAPMCAAAYCPIIIRLITKMDSCLSCAWAYCTRGRALGNHINQKYCSR